MSRIVKLSDHITKVYARTGVIIYDRQKAHTIRLTREEAEMLGDFPPVPWDELPDHPEVVAMEIIGACDLACPGCYSEDSRKRRMLTTEQWKYIMNQLADYGVFQVSFGGGEPTLRNDLGKLAEHARSLGLNLTMTTNGTVLRRHPAWVLRLFNQINVSCHPGAIPWDQSGLRTLEDGLSYLMEVGVPRGANLIITRSNLTLVPEVVRLCQKYEASLLLLTFKVPPGSDLVKEYLPPEVVRFIGWDVKRRTGLQVILDDLASYGHFGVNFCDISCEGYLMANSFDRVPQGNLLVESFKDVWERRRRPDAAPYLHHLHGEDRVEGS